MMHGQKNIKKFVIVVPQFHNQLWLVVHHRILSMLEGISTIKQKNACYIMPKERDH